MYKKVYIFISSFFILLGVSVSSCDGHNDGDILFMDDFSGDSSIPDTSVWELCKHANNAWSQHFKYVKGYENVKKTEYIRMVASEQKKAFLVILVWR